MVFIDPVTSAVSGGGAERVVFDKIDATLTATWAARPPAIPLAQWMTIVARARQQLADFANASTVTMWAADFLSYASVNPYPWSMSAQVAGGTIATISGTKNHPGIVALKSTAAANSGYALLTVANCLCLQGNESTQMVFAPVATTNTVVRMGFSDTYQLVEPTDGIWIHIAGTTLTGRTASSAARSTTPSSHTVTPGTWYRAAISLNAAGTIATFELYECSAPSVVLWTDTLAANIPLGSGRETGHAIVAYNTGVAGPAELIHLDYIEAVIGRTLVR